MLSDAHSAFVGAQSVHVRGRFSDHGVTFTLDERLVPGGGIVVERSTYGEARFLTKNAVFYLKVPTSAYATGRQSVPPSLLNQWLERPADAHDARVSLGDFFRDLDLDEDHLQPQSTVNPGARPTVTIVSTDGSRLTVAGTGKPVPLSFTAKDGSSFTFDSYDVPVSIDVPTRTTKISCGASYCEPL